MRTIIAVLLMLGTFASGYTSLSQETSQKPVSNCTDWKAWHDVQPGSAPATLHVTATCHFPTAGYSVELMPAKRKASKPDVLALRKVVHSPQGMAAQVLSDVPVQYTAETTTKYKAVLIRPDKIRVKVRAVH